MTSAIEKKFECLPLHMRGRFPKLMFSGPPLERAKLFCYEDVPQQPSVRGLRALCRAL